MPLGRGGPPQSPAQEERRGKEREGKGRQNLVGVSVNKKKLVNINNHIITINIY